ncbi:hypothetical protein BDV27DRAFT_129762 [Aspergillus caelatus]|uniref:Uncharacterized protein n=1 Tax=Aspergillus caelatus TaxID=61420 RepID=A0A5N7A2V7_9EURO|nr:uncharacterized protein BDV27DRAFT_129762 [Aspergillus caelatus]KAE8363529.1 hypothetical protein BDV27DRAFT_129762 [Aspergillus caelatus]
MVISVLCIIMRSIYRLAELSQGWLGYLITYEKCFILLDAVIMAIAVGILAIFHFDDTYQLVHGWEDAIGSWRRSLSNNT